MTCAATSFAVVAKAISEASPMTESRPNFEVMSRMMFLLDHMCILICRVGGIVVT